MRILLGMFLCPEPHFQILINKVPLVSKWHHPPQDTAPHSKFINLFSEIAIPKPGISLKCPAIGRAMEFLRFSAKTPPSHSSDRPLPEKEIERLMCIVYISFACTRSQYTRFNIELLNELLEITEHVWLGSVSTFRWLLTQSAGKGLTGLKDDQRTGRLAGIARLHPLSSYSSLEKRYLDILVQELAENGGLISRGE